MRLVWLMKGRETRYTSCGARLCSIPPTEWGWLSICLIGTPKGNSEFGSLSTCAFPIERRRTAIVTSSQYPLLKNRGNYPTFHEPTESHIHGLDGNLTYHPSKKSWFRVIPRQWEWLLPCWSNCRMLTFATVIFKSHYACLASWVVFDIWYVYIIWWYVIVIDRDTSSNKNWNINKYLFVLPLTLRDVEGKWWRKQVDVSGHLWSLSMAGGWRKSLVWPW